MYFATLKLAINRTVQDYRWFWITCRQSKKLMNIFYASLVFNLVIFGLGQKTSWKMIKNMEYFKYIIL